MDINSEIALLGKSRLTRVDAHPDAGRSSFGHWWSWNRPLRREGRLHRITRHP